MITLIAAISGFLSSIAPEILKFLKDNSDKKHELEILDKQVQYSQLMSQQRLEEIYVSRDIANSTAISSTYNTGVTWVDAFNGTVRPLLAYSFFLLYAALKYIQYKSLSDGITIENIYLIWTTDDQTIFATIISFYFGQRSFSKIWKK